jgi:hypothetical protein
MIPAALTSVVWGLAFATKLALDSFSAAQLTALRIRRWSRPSPTPQR